MELEKDYISRVKYTESYINFYPALNLSKGKVEIVKDVRKKYYSGKYFRKSYI